jgi:site-specific recombinase XerD
MSDDLVAAARPAGVPAPRLTDALTSAAGYALAEKADATRRAYRADLSRFCAWCESVGAATLPAEASTVAAYLAHCADSALSVSTIQRRAAAIGYAHKLAGHASPSAAETVKAVLRGIRRKVGAATKPKAPATAPIVAAMTKRTPATLAGKRDRAMILLGFAAALRRSELIDLKVNAIERTAEGLIVHIGKSKTDQEGLGESIAVPRGKKLRVVEALDDWLAASAIVDGPLFRRIAKGGTLLDCGLSGQSVALIVKRWAKAAKLDLKLFSGHSLRAGFVTSALDEGADIFKVMDVTRHREVKTLRVYDRRSKAFKNHAGKGFL